MDRGNPATSTRRYQGDDSEDDDDLNSDDDDDDDGDDDGYDDDDDCSGLEAASRILIRLPVQCRRILQMTIMAHTGIIPQLAHHTWIMCQTNSQKWSILL